MKWISFAFIFSVIIGTNQAQASNTTGWRALSAQTATGFALHNPNNQTVTVNISAHGQWSYANSSYVSATGSGLAALSGYLLPGQSEGALLVRHSDGTFEIAGENITISVPAGQKIAFVINDDLNSLHGNGFADNLGAIHVEWSILEESADWQPLQVVYPGINLDDL